MKKIAIIGAGISGLASAFFLRNKFDVTIFEKEDYLAGMASSFELPDKAPDGSYQSITNTYHHILDKDDETVALIKELGLGEKLKFKKIKTGFFYQGKIWPFAKASEILRFPLPLSDKFKLAKFMLRVPKDYGNKNAEEWLIEKLGQNVYNIMFKKLMENKFHKQPKDISASWVATRLEKESASARKKFGYLSGGLKNFTDKLAKESKARILLSTEVRNISKVDKKYRISFINKKNVSNTEEFDIVLNTISPTEFNMINSDFKIKEVDYLSCACAIFFTDTLVSDCYWINILDDMPFSVIFVQNNLYEGLSNNIIYVLKYFERGKDNLAGDSDIARIYLEGIKKIIPDFNVLYSKVYRVPFAEAIYYPDFENMKDRIDNVYFTGIYKFYPMIRNMNSCISEAKRIANLIKGEK